MVFDPDRLDFFKRHFVETTAHYHIIAPT